MGKQFVIKNIANIVTSLRIVFAILMVAAKPFSIIFWTAYLCAGLSDLLDGFLARKLNQQSKKGATLDSIADLFFAVAIAIVVMNNISFPVWLWGIIAEIALLRLISYAIGYYKYHTFSSLHTYANKATGALIFAFPVLYALLGLFVPAIIICVIAVVASLEEVVLTIKSTELHRDCKGFFDL